MKYNDDDDDDDVRPHSLTPLPPPESFRVDDTYQTVPAILAG